MKSVKLLVIIGSFNIILVVLLYSWLQKTIGLTIDGESQRLTSTALTVADLLKHEKITLSEADLINPPLSHWLKEGDVITIQRAVQVPILADGKLQVILTAARLPLHIFTQAKLLYSPGDMILADGKPISPETPLTINKRTGRLPTLQIRRQVSYSLTEGRQQSSLTSAAATLSQALWKAGIILSTADAIEPALQTSLTKGLQATLQRAKPVTVSIKDKSLSTWIAAGTVGEALSKLGFSMQALDYAIPPEEAPLPEVGKIRLVRVHEEIILEQTPIPFENQYQPIADLEIDQQKVMQAGEYGVKATRIRVRYEDGIEISRQVEAEWTARQPQERIIGFGTNLIPQTTETPDGTITYWRAITMYAVSYSPSSAGGSTTASGQKLRKGLVAVDTRYIPLGTRLYIPGYGEAIAADTGGAVRGRIIDLGYSDEDYVAWHENVTVYFLWPPSENIVWIFP